MPEANPIRPTDDEARALARRLIEGARFAALGVLVDGAPFVTRIGIGTDEAGHPLTLVSTLAAHTQALIADPRASLLLGEPGAKGDPLTHPRLTVTVQARFIDKPPALRARWLADHPKAGLYIDFADFGFVRFEMITGHLNGGFGKAFRLTAEDLKPPLPRQA